MYCCNDNEIDIYGKNENEIDIYGKLTLSYIEVWNIGDIIGMIYNFYLSNLNKLNYWISF